MKSIIILVFLFIASAGFSQTTKKVLFIGNSYTYYNNLPDLVSSLAATDGNTLILDSHTPGGSSLSQHASNPTVLNKITSKDWDFVVLQDQSQKPSFPYQQVQSDVYPFAEILVDSIYSNYECSLPLFYATWGRQNGDAQWDSINTFEKMNTRLFNAYAYMSSQAEGMLSPIGIGFAHIKQDANAVVNFNDLYTSDGSHQSLSGSYLAACIFNNVIYDVISIGNTYVPAGINTAEATYIQGVADHVVYDVDSIQLDFTPDLSNNTFTTAINARQVTFTPTLTDGIFELWDFGDGQTATQENVMHTYATDGTYEVTLYSSARCQSDSLKQNLDISTLDLKTEEMNSFNVYPNPSADGKITMDLIGEETYSVFTILGKEVYQGKEKQLTLTKGVYIVRHKNQSRKIIVL